MNHPLPNRVDPWSAIRAVSARGTLLGNRGILHDSDGELLRSWNGRRWIYCVLEFGDFKRTVFAPNHYTHLFFVDEATAIAAGHRPCAQCQKPRYRAFVDAWTATGTGERPLAGRIDHRLHDERTNGKTKRTYTAPLDTLPIGSMFAVEGRPYLMCGGGVREWSFDGYGELKQFSNASVVDVLTPPSTVAAIRSGFQPRVHPSALRRD